MSVNAVGTVEQRQQSPLLYGAGGAAVGGAAAGGGTAWFLNNALKNGTATDATKEAADKFIKSSRVQKAAVKAAEEAKSGLETAQKGVLELVNGQIAEGATKFEKYTDDMLNNLKGYIEAGKAEGATDAAKGLGTKAQGLFDNLLGTPAVAEVKDGAGKITTEAKKAVKGLQEQVEDFKGLYTLKDGKEVLKEGDELEKEVVNVYKTSKDGIIDRLKKMNKNTAWIAAAVAAVAAGIVAAVVISNKNKKAAAQAQAEAQTPETLKQTTQG